MIILVMIVTFITFLLIRGTTSVVSITDEVKRKDNDQTLLFCYFIVSILWGIVYHLS